MKNLLKIGFIFFFLIFSFLGEVSAGVLDPGMDKAPPVGGGSANIGKYTGDPTKVSSPKYIDDVLLVNKNTPLPSVYVPKMVSSGVKCSDGNFCQGTSESVEALKSMKADASKAGIKIIEHSSYRSYGRQKELYDAYKARDGEAAADKYSARPGFSEHQTGLTFDVYNGDSKVQLSEAFGNTKDGKWLAENAYKYGFIIRYPKGMDSETGYQYEPWHIRYIGVEHSTNMSKNGIRVLEKYLNSSTLGNEIITGDSSNGDSESSGSGEYVPVKIESQFGKGEIEFTNIGVDDKEIENQVQSSFVMNKYIGIVSGVLFKIAQVASIFLIGFIIILWLLAVLSFSGMYFANQWLRKISFNNFDVLEQGLGKMGLWTGFAFLAIVIIMTGLIPKFFSLVYHYLSIFIDFMLGLKLFY